LKRARPYGSWPSPIDSGSLVAGARVLGAPRIEGDQLYWLERRPAEAGRQVLMCGGLAPLAGGAHGAALADVREVSAPGVNVRTRVHEYGGGEYAVWRDRLFYVDDAQGCVVGGRIGSPMRPISSGDARHADLAVSPDGRWLVAVEEREREGREPENRLVAFALSSFEVDPRAPAREAPRVVAAGHDFYASPVFDHGGRRLAFLAWDHPQMPWTETALELVAWGHEGPGGAVRRIAGRAGESLFQPGFAADGSLYVVSDRSGWWNLARVADAELVPVHALRGELGRPQWVFGLSTWAWLADARVLASVTRAGRDALCEIELDTGECRERSTVFASAGGLTTGSGFAACIASTPTQGLALYAWSTGHGAPELVRDGGVPDAPDLVPSLAEDLEITLPDGRSTHAFFYAPASATSEGVGSARPPLLVKSHGGPTSSTSAGFDPRIQFWTSRGFAVADVNYSGSSGYGRAYRDRLAGEWGVLDVSDCVAVARSLAGAGRVDGDRLAITGGSAGGFTTLCALTFHDVFRAGASHYGIGDLEALVRDTHKFESRYTDWLVGRWPEQRARYVERSPIHHAEQLTCPVIFFQGLEDRVVPPNQAEDMVRALARRGLAHAYVPFAGEGHGFRRAENIRTALDGELYFYARVFGFEAPRPAAVHFVEPRP
jgi:dipeptidyl aminopeptidase/acylaminoacyl peptidase